MLSKASEVQSQAATIRQFESDLKSMDALDASLGRELAKSQEKIGFMLSSVRAVKNGQVLVGCRNGCLASIFFLQMIETRLFEMAQAILYTLTGGKMERHEILSPTINWPDLVRHVVQDQVVVELADGQIPVARLVPICKPKSFADLDHALRQLPSLGDDAERFEADIREVRSSMKPLYDPWES